MSRLGNNLRNLLLSKHKILGRREYRLCKKRLQKDEYIKDSVYGTYQGGSGILVVTNKRVLVVDRRPFFDYIEDASFDSVSHLDFVRTTMGGALYVRINKMFFRFRSYNDSKIKKIYSLLQQQLLTIGQEAPYQLSQIDTTAGEKDRKIIKPLRRRVRRHPAWSPHNPIMTGVITSSGVSLPKD